MFWRRRWVKELMMTGLQPLCDVVVELDAESMTTEEFQRANAHFGNLFGNCTPGNFSKNFHPLLCFSQQWPHVKCQTWHILSSLWISSYFHLSPTTTAFKSTWAPFTCTQCFNSIEQSIQHQSDYGVDSKRSLSIKISFVCIFFRSLAVWETILLCFLLLHRTKRNLKTFFRQRWKKIKRRNCL